MTVVATPTPTKIVPYKIPYGIVDYVLANRYTGEGHPGEHLLACRCGDGVRHEETILHITQR